MSFSARHCTTVALLVFFRKKNNKAFSGINVPSIKGIVLTLLAVCLSLCFLKAQQQILTIPVNGPISIHTLPSCDTSTAFSFISDTTTHSLYADTTPRSDTLSICPPNQRQRVRVDFSFFDLAVGDTLFVYDGKVPTLSNYSGSGSGVGITNAFGSWVTAHCSPDSNRTGCLSFVFQTNGDTIPSAGWKASASCVDRNFQIHPPSIGSQTDNCSIPYKEVTIPAALMTADCDTIYNDSTYVQVTNSDGVLCMDTCLSKSQNMSFTETFAYGSYIVKYKWKQDTTIQQETYFSVQPRSMVCNDTLNIGMDAQCSVQIIPDMLLESHCDTISDTLYYEINISVPDEKLGRKIIASGSGRSGGYPLITKDLVDYCGDVVYTAEIIRYYYDGLNLNICNDGPQISTCWTYLRFEDKAAPLFAAPIQCDTIYACDVEMTPEALGLKLPVVVDNCDSTEVLFAGVELISTPTACDTLDLYLVTWETTDNCGNARIRQDTVKIYRPGIDKIVKVPDYVLSCGMDDSTAVDDLDRLGAPGLQIGYKKNGVFVVTDTIPLIENAPICNYNIERSDVRISVDCNDKYYRYWQLLDWCSNSNALITIDTQLIEYKDTLAPQINCPNYTSLATAEKLDLPGNSCQMVVNFPLPTATDKCVANPQVEEFTVEVLESSGWWSVGTSLAGIGALECDTFRVGYRAFDDCHHEQLKEDTCYRYFIIRDVAAPTAICVDKLTISIGGDTTYLWADAIDGGSWDMCQVDTIFARRTVCNDVSTYRGVDNPYVIDKLGANVDAKGWVAELGFTCCDVHHPLFAELLVIDKKGNHNTCWMEIKVEDKILPICQPLPPVTAFCDEYTGFELGPETDTDNNSSFDPTEWIPLVGGLEVFYNETFGNPTEACEDNVDCNALMMEQEYQLVKQSCGEVNIKRRYRVIDYGKNQSEWAEQLINLVYRPAWKITFPIDQQGNCDSKIEAPASPIINGNCDQLSWDYEEEVFETVNDVFVKVIRTYSIINWCIYQPGEAPLIIKRNENHKKEVTTPQLISSDSLGEVGFIQYTQILKVVDADKPFLALADVDTILLGKGDAYPYGEEDQTPGEAPYECDVVKIFQVFARDCNEATSENLSYKWEIYQEDILLANGIGDTFSYTVYPGIRYKVSWWVTDLFNNTNHISKTYTFADGLAPYVYCNNGIVAESTPGNRFVRVSAEMFDKGSFDNCTDQSLLTRRLWHQVLNIHRPQTAVEVAALPSYLELGCFYIGTQNVSLYVMDEAGNFDYCTTKLIIQNNMLSCHRRNVSGEIMDLLGRPIEEVEVDVTSTDMNLTLMSDGDGGFEFTMPDGADYTIRPNKDNDPLNGVTTFDLVLISQHILGINKFDSPYKYLAADVNKSGTVTAFDLVQIRQLILNIVPSFPNNTSWRFVDMEYEFSTESSGMELADKQEEKTIRDLSGDRLGMDFLGVKIGDINGSAVPNRSSNAGGRSSTKTLTISAENQQLEKGKIYTVPFYAKNLDQITGYQFTINFKNIKLIQIEGGVASLDNFGRTMEHRGILTTSWHSLQSRETTTSLFSLTFQATKEGTLNELLKITSDYTPAEAYGFSGTFYDVSLTFSESSPIPFQVYQNTPNPFTHHTIVAFDLPAKGNVVFQLVNSQGQVVKKLSETYQRGYNELSLSLKNIADGTYYYQLATPFGVETKKMIKVQ